MRYTIRTVSPASPEPVIDLDAAKAHLGVDGGDDDALIEAYVLAAQDAIERHTSRVLTPRVMEMAGDRFPCLPELIDLPREPVTGIVSVTYTDSDGEAVAMDAADYRWSEDVPDVLKPAFRAAWPVAAAEAGSVRVRFNAGYDAGLAPPSLVHAVKMLMGHMYANRETVVTGTIATALPFGVEQLCAPFRKVSI